MTRAWDKAMRAHPCFEKFSGRLPLPSTPILSSPLISSATSGSTTNDQWVSCLRSPCEALSLGVLCCCNRPHVVSSCASCSRVFTETDERAKKGIELLSPRNDTVSQPDARDACADQSGRAVEEFSGSTEGRLRVARRLHACSQYMRRAHALANSICLVLTPFAPHLECPGRRRRSFERHP